MSSITFIDKLDQARFVDGSNPPLISVVGSESTFRESGPHHHPSGQLFGLLSGLLSVRTHMGTWVVPCSRGVWIPPSVMHEGRSHGAFNGWSVYVSPQSSIGLPKEPRVIEVSPLLREAVLRAGAWETGVLRPSQLRLAQVILDEIGESTADTFWLPMPADSRLQRIAISLTEQPADERSLEEWALWGHITSRTLSRKFVDETGLTFTAWRQRARLLRALELLAAGKTVTTIALELGYDNVSAFIALFKRTFGVTPGRYLAENI
ncbi:helix-turn-helix transcriptional regulator [Achromobacter kerstersii]|uniref:AraC family transcriptional regulator n=1 Tax=Achromobacter kerstersii TaxID=1353890 RepID=UPI00313E7D3E